LLDDIPNIGEKRKKDLLFNFKSIDNIKKATYEELLSIPSMDKKSAESVLKFFE